MGLQAALKRVEDLIEPVLLNMGYELVERELVMEGGGWVLRLYIDRDGGVTVDDCERVSHGIEDLIEVEDIIPFRYNLEVSSPGIDRPLRRREDFVRFLGSSIRLRTLHPVDGRSNFKGRLGGMDGDDILMHIDGGEFRIPIYELARARLEPDDSGSGGKSIN